MSLKTFYVFIVYNFQTKFSNKTPFEMNQKTIFLVLKRLSFRHIKQTSRSLADTTFREFLPETTNFP